jgi:phytoene desaturase
VKVVVVGAGVGGLAVAARLAAQGHAVELHERSATHGGKLGEFRRDGFVFDTGPSLLTMPQVFEELFADTGGPSGLDVVPVDPACRYRFADGTTLDLPHDPAAVPAALDAALGPGAGASWLALHTRSARLWDLVGDAVLRRPLDGAADLLRFSLRLRDLRLIAPWRSLRRLGTATFPDPRLRAWLDRYATYSGSDPRRTPSVLSVTSYVEQHFGAWYVRGGLRRIADALLQRCAALGVRVHLASAVAQVRTDDRGVCGVRLADGTEVAADVVVCNADASVLYGGLLRHRAERPGGALAAPGPALAVRVRAPARPRRVRARPRHRVFFPRDYDASSTPPWAAPPAPVADPAIYVHAPDDPALRPDDASQGWFVLVNAAPHDPGRGVDWDAPGLAQRYADLVLQRLAERGTDVRGRVRWREVRTPADLERATGAPGGAIYGTASHGPRAGAAAPGQPVAGAGSVPGGRLGAPGRRATPRCALRGHRRRHDRLTARPRRQAGGGCVRGRPRWPGRGSRTRGRTP